MHLRLLARQSSAPDYRAPTKVRREGVDKASKQLPYTPEQLKAAGRGAVEAANLAFFAPASDPGGFVGAAIRRLPNERPCCAF